MKTASLDDEKTSTRTPHFLLILKKVVVVPSSLK